MHALCRAASITGDSKYTRWAGELAHRSFEAFVRRWVSGEVAGVTWKMSTDLLRSLVPAMGKHDALDGLITFWEIQQAMHDRTANLNQAIETLHPLCLHADWTTDDPLGLGGLLFDSYRLAQLLRGDHQRDVRLLEDLLQACCGALAALLASRYLDRPAMHRLAFRELGLAIGLGALPMIAEVVKRGGTRLWDRPNLRRPIELLLPYEPLGGEIVDLWLEHAQLNDKGWDAHRDINEVMLATALIPVMFLSVGSGIPYAPSLRSRDAGRPPFMIEAMDQSATIAFLSSPAAFGGGTDIEIVETHGAYVFLCGDAALKLKRAVKYDYMDLSTVERRRAMLVRELELNGPAAPEVYRDVVPVTCGPDGFTLGGDGPVADWVLRMWRFPAENAFEAIAERGTFDDRLATAMGETIAAYHASAPIVRRPGAEPIEAILAELARIFAGFQDAAGTARVNEWLVASRDALERNRAPLDARGRSDHVRRGHGDLHLRNLVLIGGRPVPFDALEFDENLGSCDVLYDIAFLLMDLCHRDLRPQACCVLDGWLREARGGEDSGLAALPLFLSVRAAIRAMVLLQTDAARGQSGASAAELAAYLDLACAALSPPSPPR